MKKSDREKIEVTPRPPIVVVVGHIDHGKSTLLDYIRQTSVAEKETGGITQRVSAYEVTTSPGKTITFLDTPGHAAFSGIRECSAKIADLAIVVVSAEEGVKAQTLEALTAVTTAKLPYLIAINKIDRPNASVDRTKQSLAENSLLVEGYGGTIPWVAISAKTGEGIPDLLELILLMAEMAELGDKVDELARGFVLEATRDSKVGIITTLIIKSGVLRSGDFLVVGKTVGRIKKLENFLGQPVDQLDAGRPAVVLGLPDLPETGCGFTTAKDKPTAEALAKIITDVGKETALGSDVTTGATVMPIILKADNVGSLEALVKEVNKLKTEVVTLSIVARSVGQITENDVKLGLGTSHALIIGFNVRIEKSASELAEKHGVTIKTFDIIYHLSEWLMEEITRHTPVVTVEETIGEVKVLKIFSHEKNKQIIGASVTTGYAVERHPIKIVRRGTPIGEGEMVELKQQKITIKRAEVGEQFGALVESKIAIAPGDTITIFTRIKR